MLCSSIKTKLLNNLFAPGSVEELKDRKLRRLKFPSFAEKDDEPATDVEVSSEQVPESIRREQQAKVCCCQVQVLYTEY